MSGIKIDRINIEIAQNAWDTYDVLTVTVTLVLFHAVRIKYYGTDQQHNIIWYYICYNFLHFGLLLEALGSIYTPQFSYPENRKHYFTD